MRRLLPCLRLLLVLAAALAGAFVATIVPAGTASAHNSFSSSDPADGSTLDEAPQQISLLFENDVPLDSAAVTLIDPSGARTEITELGHGPAGTNEVIAALPALPAGESSVRWSLTSSDGHVISGRVRFTVIEPTAATEAPSGTGAPVETPSTTIAPDSGVSTLDGDLEPDTTGAPDVLRWLLRYASYALIAVVIGLALTERLVWPGASRLAMLRSLSAGSLAVLAVLGLTQLTVLAADVEADGRWFSLGGVDRALSTDAGLALLSRVVLCLGTFLVVHRMVIRTEEVRTTAVGVVGVLLLGTWAWAGHAHSQRWPLVGVLTDIAHHGAAALWLGALGVVGLVAAPRLAPVDLAPVMQRLSRTAFTAVVVIVATGLVQSLRLVGNPVELFDGRHSVLLVVKVVLVAVMVVIARTNRERVVGLSREHDPVATVQAVRSAILVELAIGLVVLAVTASLVVAPPATSL